MCHDGLRSITTTERPYCRPISGRSGDDSRTAVQTYTQSAGNELYNMADHERRSIQEPCHRRVPQRLAAFLFQSEKLPASLLSHRADWKPSHSNPSTPPADILKFFIHINLPKRFTFTFFGESFFKRIIFNYCKAFPVGTKGSGM